MVVLFDLMSTQPQGKIKFHGGGEYAKRVFFELLKKNTNINIIVLFEQFKTVSPEIMNACSNNDCKLYYIESREDLKSIFLTEIIDVFFIAIYNDFFKCQIPSHVRVIFTCHDLRMFDIVYDQTAEIYENERFIDCIKNKIKRYAPFLHKLYLKHIVNNTVGELLNRANTIITVSEYSRDSISKKFPRLKHDKIIVCYAPYKIILNEKKVKKKSGKFFLLIGANRYEKNAYRALRALDNLFSKNKLEEYSVVCIGGKQEKFSKEVINKDKFFFEDYVDDSKLQMYYRNAFAFIFPSLAEGFGYPPLEAMKYGTLVLTSSVTSIPEICGDAALYFNPYKVEEIEIKILYAVNEDMNCIRQKAALRYEHIKRIQDESLNKIIHEILK